MNKLVIIGIALVSVVSLIILVSALTDDDKTALQSELSQLEANLSSQDYGWLVDYNLNKNGGEI